MKEAIRIDYKNNKKQVMMLCCFFTPVTIIGCLSLVPNLGLPNPFPMFDKLEHTGAYLLLSLLAKICFTPRKHRQVIYFLIAFSVIMECLQILTPPREPDPIDAFFNCVGIGLGVWAGTGVRRILRSFLSFQEMQKSQSA